MHNDNLFSVLENVQIDFIDGPNIFAFQNALLTLFEEATPSDHATAAAMGSNLVIVNMITADKYPEYLRDAILGITVTGANGTSLEKLVASMRELSGIFDGAPVTSDPNDIGIKLVAIAGQTNTEILAPYRKAIANQPEGAVAEAISGSSAKPAPASNTSGPAQA